MKIYLYWILTTYSDATLALAVASRDQHVAACRDRHAVVLDACQLNIHLQRKQSDPRSSIAHPYAKHHDHHQTDDSLHY